MSRVYTCIGCHTIMNYSLIPYCPSCRLEQALKKKTSENTYNSSFETLSDKLERLGAYDRIGRRGMPL